LRTLGADLWSGGRLLLSQASTIVGADGAITDAATRENIRRFMAGFVKFISKQKSVAL
jgi:chromate reductase, NAD(P)H dehydrogenase (quinone)